MKFKWLTFKGKPYWLRGGIAGGLISVAGSVFMLISSIKLLVVDTWPGSGSMGVNGANIGWALISGFLALIVAAVAFLALLVVFFPAGAAIGWVFGKIRPAKGKKS